MVWALAVGLSRVSTTMPSASRSQRTASAEALAAACSSRLDWVMGSALSSLALRSQALDDGRDAHPTAHAQGGQAVAQLPALQLVQERAEHHGSRGAERVPHGDRATVDVDLVVGDPEVTQEGKHNR